MNEHYPRIRLHSTGSNILIISEGVSLCFYMRRPHREVVPAVLRSLDEYLRIIGPGALTWYAVPDDWYPLDDASMGHLRRELLDEVQLGIALSGEVAAEKRYGFEYIGGRLDDPYIMEVSPHTVCAVRFWLPTEYLEKHGPDHVRSLALELAALLPFDSGHVGLAYHGGLDLIGVKRELHRFCFRYPGIDIQEWSWTTGHIGTRVRGPAWLTFLGQPVLGELGGVSGLRSRLHSPATTVEEMVGDRAVVTLGQWPEAGDTEQGNRLPAYRELASVLEPWLYFPDVRGNDVFFPNEDWRRWERRFLD